MPYSESQNKATQKYVKNAYDEIKVRIPKGKKALYQQRAKELGKSLNAYIVSLLEEETSAAFGDTQMLKNAGASVQQVAATMAIEDMYFTKEFMDKMLKVAAGDISSEEVRKEVLKRYAR